MMNWKLSLVIPVYNEAGNILPLLEEWRDARDGDFPAELVIVDNGSTDGSGELLREAAATLPWVRVLRLDRNAGYGGGVWFGLKNVAEDATHVGWVPADRQYLPGDVRRVWNAVLDEPWALHQGQRTVRRDARDVRFVSTVYSALVRIFLGVEARDCNGLPKIAPRALVGALGPKPARHFLFEAEVLCRAECLGLPLRQHAVTFLPRRVGVSSWSKRRLATYLETLAGLWRLRRAIRAVESAPFS